MYFKLMTHPVLPYVCVVEIECYLHHDSTGFEVVVCWLSTVLFRRRKGFVGMMV